MTKLIDSVIACLDAAQVFAADPMPITRAIYDKRLKVLVDEIALVERGAARYRWLREQHWVEGEGRARLGLMCATANHEADIQEFDAAIDKRRAAMKETT